MCFLKTMRFCALDESSLSIGRVKPLKSDQFTFPTRSIYTTKLLSAKDFFPPIITQEGDNLISGKMHARDCITFLRSMENALSDFEGIVSGPGFRRRLHGVYTTQMNFATCL